VDVPGRRGLPPVRVALDEAPAKLDAGRLRGLRPAFRPGGSVIAGNSSPVTDGAAALVLASRGAAARLGLPVRGAWPAAPRQEPSLRDCAMFAGGLPRRPLRPAGGGSHPGSAAAVRSCAVLARPSLFRARHGSHRFAGHLSGAYRNDTRRRAHGLACCTMQRAAPNILCVRRQTAMRPHAMRAAMRAEN